MRLLLIALAACSEGPHVIADYSRPNHLLDAPFPSDDLFDGANVNVAGFPNRSNSLELEQARVLLADNGGFATTGGAFFQISEPLDPTSLPSIAGSVADDSSAFIIAIDRSAADYGMRYPVAVSFREMPSIYSVPNVVALLPVQGTPLRPHERYAAILTTAVRSAKGESLDRAHDDTIDRHNVPLADLGIDEDDVAGITAFTTADATAQLATVLDAALARPLPTIDAPFTLVDTFTDFCVYHTTIAMPDWQSGTPPFNAEGGTWTFDASGAPIFQRTETANLVLTIPRQPLPAAGYPIVVFVRTGGGGDRPLVDRGTRATPGGAAVEAGEGPARYLARAGFAGVQVDGPLGGLRNTTGQDEQFLTFNVGNLGAMRDNIRESAVELSVIARVALALHVNTNMCSGAGGSDVTFDASHVAIMGHSMGSWIAPIAAAYDPVFRALILSGAGGSWIENIMWKRKPLAPLPVIAALLRVDELLPDDPVLTFAQWALESSDPQIYGRMILRDTTMPRHVLMVQGIVDNYILPRIANATSLSISLDLAGPALDNPDDPRLQGQLALSPLLPLVGRQAITLPAAANVGGATAVVTQHVEDGIEDGHEVLFQTDAPKHEYQCFLASWLTGTPSVPVDASRDAPCP